MRIKHVLAKKYRFDMQFQCIEAIFTPNDDVFVFIMPLHGCSFLPHQCKGQAYSKERAALPFKGTRIREPRSRTARQQYRSHPTTWKEDLPQEERQRNRRQREIILPKQKRLDEPLNEGVKEHPTPLNCFLET